MILFGSYTLLPLFGVCQTFEYRNSGYLTTLQWIGPVTNNYHLLLRPSIKAFVPDLSAGVALSGLPLLRYGSKPATDQGDPNTAKLIIDVDINHYKSTYHGYIYIYMYFDLQSIYMEVWDSCFIDINGAHKECIYYICMCIHTCKPVRWMTPRPCTCRVSCSEEGRCLAFFPPKLDSDPMRSRQYLYSTTLFGLDSWYENKEWFSLSIFIHQQDL